MDIALPALAAFVVIADGVAHFSVPAGFAALVPAF